MIKAVIFDLDNTLMDFMKMKSMSVDAAINGMIEAGLDIDFSDSKNKIYDIYEKKGFEYQEVFDDFIKNECGCLENKYLAAAIVSYRKIKDATMVLYPNVNSTLIKLSKFGLKLGVLTDAPSREAWIRLYSVSMHHLFDAVVTLEDTGQCKPSPEPFIKISKLLNEEYENILMVGDWPERDVIGAKQLNMKTAFAKYGDMFKTKHSGADYDLNDISEIIQIINDD
ncbi:MAG: hypothetical protein CMG26_01515 [Candidatus Marinimicrobia bacterium]|nr:hypothetical protein [Candidatus Neomarinimicrobiota bacterium]